MGLLENIIAGSKHTIDTVWPGTNETIKLRVLNAQDYHEITLACSVIYHDIKIGVQNVDEYAAEKATQMLWRAIIDPETGKQLFSKITDFRKAITIEQRGILVEELLAFHDDISPDPETISDTEFDKLLKDIKKNAEMTIGDVSSIHTLRKLIIYLVSPPQK
jgi:hypothetical protein